MNCRADTTAPEELELAGPFTSYRAVDGVSWRGWVGEDEFAAFHPTTGDTHVLGSVEVWILDRVGSEARCALELAQSISGELPEGSRAEAFPTVQRVLAALEAAALIERVSA